jgi:FkbM family methyltransferase
LIGKVWAWRRAVFVARKHCSNWAWLVIKSLLRARGRFRSRQGGSLSCDARKLLKSLVRLESMWRRNGETLPIIKFESDHLIIPGYFGRDFRLPLNSADGVASPSALLNKYPFSVAGEVVLDIGAWLGDTPLMWLYKGAKYVIAVEPVPLHFCYLEKNTAGLPVICLKASLAVKLPSIPAAEGSNKYGLWDASNGDFDTLDVPTVQLIDLVKTYKPGIVKLNCEGCEHYVLEQLSEPPRFGVKIIAVEFHGIRGLDPYESIVHLEKKLGKGVIISDKCSQVKVVDVYWKL